MKKKPVALLLSGALLLGCTVGGTLAWLTDESEAVSNTFTVGDVQIALEETTGNEYKMTPGVTLPKDPTVTVMAGSEDCYVFIKVEESSAFDTYMTYDIDPNNWQQLTDPQEKDVDGIYCTKGAVKNIEEDRNIKVLGYTQDGEFHPNEILVNDTITKEKMQNLEKAGSDSYPTLRFTAYAIQLYKTNDTEWATPYEAWTAITGQLKE